MLSTYFTKQPLKDYELMLQSPFALRYICIEAIPALLFRYLSGLNRSLRVFLSTKTHLHWVLCKTNHQDTMWTAADYDLD